MATRITRIKCTHFAHSRISWQKLAEISGMSVEEYKKSYAKQFGSFTNLDLRPFAEGIECPFGERNLMDDTWYLGSNEHRCPYFVRYEHGNNGSTIICKCPKPRKAIQLTLF